MLCAASARRLCLQGAADTCPTSLVLLGRGLLPSLQLPNTRTFLALYDFKHIGATRCHHKNEVQTVRNLATESLHPLLGRESQM